MIKGVVPAVQSLVKEKVRDPRKGTYQGTIGREHSSGFSKVQGGAGWIGPTQFHLLPDFFKPLADLLVYYEITIQSTAIGNYEVYSLNGVSTSTAIAAYDAGAGWFVLYMPAAQGSLGWYYLLNWFGFPPPPTVGPELTTAQASEMGAAYVAISQGGTSSLGIMNGIFTPTPLNLSKFTLVGS